MTLPIVYCQLLNCFQNSPKGEAAWDTARLHNPQNKIDALQSLPLLKHFQTENSLGVEDRWKMVPCPQSWAQSKLGNAVSKFYLGKAELKNTKM